MDARRAARRCGSGTVTGLRRGGVSERYGERAVAPQPDLFADSNGPPDEDAKTGLRGRGTDRTGCFQVLMSSFGVPQ